jgi:hypothetical protein
MTDMWVVIGSRSWSATASAWQVDEDRLRAVAEPSGAGPRAAVEFHPDAVAAVVQVALEAGDERLGAAALLSLSSVLALALGSVVAISDALAFA